MSVANRIEYIIAAQEQFRKVMQSFGSTLDDAHKKLDQLQKSADSANKSLKNSLQSFNDGTKKVAQFGAAALGMATVLGGAAVKAASDFQNSMAEVQSIIGDDQEHMAMLTEEVKKFATESTKPLSEITGALIEIAGAGIKNEEQMAALRDSTKLSVAGLGSVAEATDIVTSAMNSFGRSSQDAAEILNVAINYGKTNVSELARGFGGVAPLVNQMGVSMEEFGAIIGASTQTGKKASEVYTQTKAVLTNLIKPTEDLQKVYKQLGVTTGEELIAKSGGLVEALKAIQKEGGSTSDKLGAMFSSAEALSLIMELTGSNAQFFENAIAGMADKSAIMDEAFKANSITANALWEKVQNNLNVAMINLGNVILPNVVTAMENLNGIIQQAINWWNDLSTENQNLTITLAGVAAAMIAGATASSAIASAIGSIKLAILALQAPLGWIPLAVAAVGAAIGLAVYAWNTNLFGFRDVVTNVFNAVGQWLQQLGLWFENLKLKVSNTWLVIAEKIVWAVSVALDWLAKLTGNSAMQEWADAAKAKSEEMKASIEENTTRMAQIVEEQTALAKKHAEDNLARMLDSATQLTGEAKEIAMENWAEQAEAAQEKYGDIVLATTEGLSTVRNVTKQESQKTAQIMAQVLHAMALTATKSAGEMKIGVVGEAEKMNVGVTAQATATAKNVDSAFESAGANAGTWGEHAVANYARGIRAGIAGPLTQALAQFRATVYEQMHQSYNPLTPVKEWGEHLLENYAKGMKESQPKVFAQTEELRDIIKKKFGNDGEIMKILTEFDKDKKTAEQFQKIWDDIVAGAEKLQGEFDNLKASYGDLALDAGKNLADLQKDHADAMADMTEKIGDLQTKLSELKDSYRLDIGDVNTSIAEKFVDQEGIVASLSEALKKAQEDAFSDPLNLNAIAKVEELQAQLDKESGALAAFAEQAKQYENEIAEVRRRNDLTGFERFLEDAQAKKDELTKQFNEKKQQIQDEIKLLEDQKLKESLIYEEKIALYQKTQDAFIYMQGIFEQGFDSMGATAEEQVLRIKKQIESLKNSMDFIGNFGNVTPSIINSQITPPSITGFATGGIVNKPTMAMIGEAGMSEAIVPLPNGRSIPVEMRGGTNQTFRIEININGDNYLKSETDMDTLIRKIEQEFIRKIQLERIGSA